MNSNGVYFLRLDKDAGERWIFLVHPGGWPEFYDALIRYANDDELTFTKEDADTCCRIAGETFAGW